VAVNWTGLPWASAVGGLRFIDCNIYAGAGDEPHAIVIAIARIARKRMEGTYFLMQTSCRLGLPARTSGCLLSIISKILV